MTTTDADRADRQAEDWEHAVGAFETAFMQHVGAYSCCDLRDPTDIDLFLQLFGNMLRENARERDPEEDACT